MSNEVTQDPRKGRNSGFFIVFEGGDSAGKTTQLRLLARWLIEGGIEPVITREPGDTWLGEQIRHLVLDINSGAISPRAEALVYAADKAQHVDEVVQPALDRGEVVVCDRYVDSTLAYQGAGRVLDPDDVEQIARWATHDLLPDLTILLDVEPQQAVATKDVLDRVEDAGHDFHSRVREFFLKLAAADPEHYLVIPGRQSIEDIAGQIRGHIEPLLQDRKLLAS